MINMAIFLAGGFLVLMMVIVIVLLCIDEHHRKALVELRPKVDKYEKSILEKWKKDEHK